MRHTKEINYAVPLISCESLKIARFVIHGQINKCYAVQLINRELTQQEGWKAQDGKMTKKCRVILGMHSLARYCFVILLS